MAQKTAQLLISCPDTRGIIAAVTGFVAQHNGNILEADQHTDPQQGEFLMRLEVELDGFQLNQENFESKWSTLAKQYDMRWHIHWSNVTKRMAILVSKESHCLSDLLWRWKTGELHVDIPLIAGNHESLKETAQSAGITFHHLPITPTNKSAQESQLRDLLDRASVDFVVLARYMQILSPSFVAAYPERIINIHHSFLPAFAGPKPYHHAFERGVKIIGATSHYVTNELDAGPIIAQSTMPVDHRDTVDDLIRKGRDLEKVVLSTAVRLHTQDKILVCKNKTVVFD